VAIGKSSAPERPSALLLRRLGLSHRADRLRWAVDGPHAEEPVTLVDALLQTDLHGLRKRSGKVRDVYELGDDRLLIVATDRISAFDWVLPNGIPDKGRVLTAISAWWFRRLRARSCPDHLISTEIEDAGLDLSPRQSECLRGRVMVVRRADVVPFECVVRGYLSGSGWKEYRQSGTVCGEPLPAGLVESGKLPEARFTPATKAESGHDENVPLARLVEALGRDLAIYLRDMSIAYYEEAARVAEARGLILADTKFEFGRVPDSPWPILVDEVLTPDSSRYWDAASYRPGGPQPSFDKQFVRDWLESTGWDKASPPPCLPDAVVERTRAKYIECYDRLTGEPFPWT
jgi:phosphoribosylaminoimidazole-succinocarboxamide synthase